MLSSWKPEGSLYTSDVFQQALAKSRQRTPTIRQLSPHPSACHRNALVFEHEITLESEGRTKRWSVQVPAESMNPDLVDMMVELRNLNSYFKEEDQDVEEKEEREKQLTASVDIAYAHPPSLIVSNSHCVIPLSLESAGSLHTTPKTLAMRRGNKSLASLSLNPEPMDSNSYPSIPTAFLGSPSSYHPTFEFIGNAPSSANFQGMIDSLRSQCASLQVKPESCPALQAEEGLLTVVHLDSHSSPKADDGDDWAFADGLLKRFPDLCVEDHEADIVGGVMQESEESFLEATLGVVISDPSLSNDSPCPSSASLINASPTLLSNSPRGILKRCKSVRFAESPLIDQAVMATALVQEVTPARALKRPSPLRNTYSSRSNSTALSDSISPLLRAVGRQQSSKTAPVSSRTTQVQLLNRSPTTKPTVPHMRDSNISSTDQAKQKTQATPSLGRSFRNTLISGKENKKVKAKSSFSSNRHTMDENALRRTISSPSQTQKSRMPVPLRNIFIKFK